MHRLIRCTLGKKGLSSSVAAFRPLNLTQGCALMNRKVLYSKDERFDLEIDDEKEKDEFVEFSKAKSSKQLKMQGFKKDKHGYFKISGDWDDTENPDYEKYMEKKRRKQQGIIDSESEDDNFVTAMEVVKHAAVAFGATKKQRAEADELDLDEFDTEESDAEELEDIPEDMRKDPLASVEIAPNKMEMLESNFNTFRQDWETAKKYLYPDVDFEKLKLDVFSGEKNDAATAATAAENATADSSTGSPSSATSAKPIDNSFVNMHTYIKPSEGASSEIESLLQSSASSFVNMDKVHTQSKYKEEHTGSMSNFTVKHSAASKPTAEGAKEANKPNLVAKTKKSAPNSKHGETASTKSSATQSVESTANSDAQGITNQEPKNSLDMSVISKFIKSEMKSSKDNVAINTPEEAVNVFQKFASEFNTLEVDSKSGKDKRVLGLDQNQVDEIVSDFIRPQSAGKRLVPDTEHLQTKYQKVKNMEAEQTKVNEAERHGAKDEKASPKKASKTKKKKLISKSLKNMERTCERYTKSIGEMQALLDKTKDPNYSPTLGDLAKMEAAINPLNKKKSKTKQNQASEDAVKNMGSTLDMKNFAPGAIDYSVLPDNIKQMMQRLENIHSQNPSITDAELVKKLEEELEGLKDSRTAGSSGGKTETHRSNSATANPSASHSATEDELPGLGTPDISEVNEFLRAQGYGADFNNLTDEQMVELLTKMEKDIAEMQQQQQQQQQQSPDSPNSGK